MEVFKIMEYRFGEIRTKESILKLGIAPVQIHGADEAGIRPGVLQQGTSELLDCDVTPEGWEECLAARVRNSAA